MTLVIDPKVALLKGVDPVQFCVFFLFPGIGRYLRKRQIKPIWLRSLRLFKIYMNKGGFLL